MHSVPGSGHVVAGRYRLVDQIGRGAMGIVWRGRDQLLDREVAVKQIVLAPMTSQTQAEASFQRTLREARTAARLSHPSVVTVFDVVEENGAPWIVMELVHARPLDQVIAEDGPLPPVRAAQLGLSLLDALVTAHAAGVLHRDVKPSNVLIRPDGKPVLTDFGIATIQGDPGLTQAGMVVGTPGFAPPERVRGEPATPASDLWSLGATLYAAVEGRGPFDRAGGSAAIVASIATEPAPRAPSAGPLAPVIEELLRADPAQRPNAAATQRLLADAWSAARTPDPTRRRALPDRAGQPGPAGSPASPADGAEATTSTQIVTVPTGASPRGDLAAAGIAGYPDDDLAGAGEHAPVAGDDPAADAAVAPAAPLSPAAAAAIGVVPDLMATPVFAELKMPEATNDAFAAPDHGSSGNDAQAIGDDAAGGGEPRAERSKLGRLVRSKRGLVLIAPIAVIAIVVGVASFVLHGFPPSAAQGLGNVTQGDHGRHSTPPAGQSSSPQPKTSSPHHGGAPGGHHASGGPSSPGRPSHSGKPSSSPTPTPTPTKSPSPTPTPTPTPDPNPTPPPGYAWYTVSASNAGATAGFRVAAPSLWVLTPGLTSTIRPLVGGLRLTVDMAPFAVQGPLREARHLQAVAIANHTYRAYHLVSILPTTFHGKAAATWAFWWRPSALAKVIDVTKLIYTAHTAAGLQPYILSMASPAPSETYANHVFLVALRTFRARP